MDYRDLIRQSWLFTQSHKRLIVWFGFLPSLFTTGFGIIYLTYQFFAFKRSEFFDNATHSFLYETSRFTITFIRDHISLSVPLLAVTAVLIILYLLLPTMLQAASIQYISRIRSGHSSTLGEGFRHGLMAFLPLFEYHLLIKTFGLFTLLGEIAFVIRNVQIPFVRTLLIIILSSAAIIGLLLTLLFTYTDFYIVIDKKEVFESIKKSCKLVILHWQKTFLLTVLMLIIGARIIFQIIVVMLVPTVVIGVAGYIATVTFAQIGIVIGLIIGLAALFFASYLGAVVEIFANTVWTYTFLDLTTKPELNARGEME